MGEELIEKVCLNLTLKDGQDLENRHSRLRELDKVENCFLIMFKYLLNEFLSIDAR